MGIKDENEKEKDLERNGTPYEKLNYIYELCSFYKQIGEDLGSKDIQGMLDKIIKVTRKYKRI